MKREKLPLLLLLLLDDFLVGRLLGRGFPSQLEFRSRRIILDCVIRDTTDWARSGCHIPLGSR